MNGGAVMLACILLIIIGALVFWHFDRKADVIDRTYPFDFEAFARAGGISVLGLICIIGGFCGAVIYLLTHR